MRNSSRLQPTRFAKGMSLAYEEGLNDKVMTKGRGLASEAEIHTHYTGIIFRPRVRPPLSQGVE